MCRASEVRQTRTNRAETGLLHLSQHQGLSSLGCAHHGAEYTLKIERGTEREREREREREEKG